MSSLETLRKSREFQHVFRAGKSIPGREFVLYGMRTRRPVTRFGFTVSKKVGSAVVRNRLRRRLREICRTRLATFAPGWDLVFVARSDGAAATFESLVTAFHGQSERLGCCVVDLA